jgi:hypothetical protein
MRPAAMAWAPSKRLHLHATIALPAGGFKYHGHLATVCVVFLRRSRPDVLASVISRIHCYGQRGRNMSRSPGFGVPDRAWSVGGLVARWGARISGTLLAGMVLLFIIGEGPPPLVRGSLSENLMSLAGLVCLTGYVVIWFRELPGGLVSLLGIASFYGLNYAASGRLPGGWVLPMFFVPGALAVTATLLVSRFRASPSR